MAVDRSFAAAPLALERVLKLTHGRLVPILLPSPDSEGSRRGVILQLHDDTGKAGQGESSPIHGETHDDIERAEGILARIPWDKLPAINLDQPWAPQLRWLLSPIDLDCLSALFAAETALLDLIGQHLGQPLCALLAGEQCHGEVPLEYAYPHPLRSSSDAMNAILSALEQGRTTIALKVGTEGRVRELNVIKAIKRRFNERIALRFEFASPLDPAEAEARVAELAEFAPEFVVQPAASSAMWRLPSPLALAIRDDLHTVDVLEGLLGVTIDERMDLFQPGPLPEPWFGPGRKPRQPRGQVRVVVLRPMALGGLMRAWRIAREAQSCGYRITVGQQSNGPVALAAYAEFAVSLPQVPSACGLGLHPGIPGDVLVPQVHEHMVTSGLQPGLGLERILPRDRAD